MASMAYNGVYGVGIEEDYGAAFCEIFGWCTKGAGNLLNGKLLWENELWRFERISAN